MVVYFVTPMLQSA